jgi:hypothetical protein
MARVDAIEDLSQIKVATFMAKVQMPLHWQHWSSDFSFWFFLCHGNDHCQRLRYESKMGAQR